MEGGSNVGETRNMPEATSLSWSPPGQTGTTLALVLSDRVTSVP